MHSMTVQPESEAAVHAGDPEHSRTVSDDGDPERSQFAVSVVTGSNSNIVKHQHGAIRKKCDSGQCWYFTT